ncbi:MAG: tetraacyldisaccharide 4'-kinase [Planctomycetota bacterium]|nr:tetraacyldisaccharide 4'-kinase [Planctomycetota bacterium]
MEALKETSLEFRLRSTLEGGGGFPGAILRGALRPLGLAYGGLMRLRRLAYERHLLPTGKATLPVISVGNLTVGGSGKTPLTAWLAKEFHQQGLRVGILLRGYRSLDGWSDEAEFYRQRLPGHPLVEVGADRLSGSLRAAAAGADILIMDDGFQHLRLGRDLDIVLVDALSPWGGGVALPGGLLREPRSSLAQADLVVLTRSDQCLPSSLPYIQEEIHRLAPAAELFLARHRPSCLYRLNGQPQPMEQLKGRQVIPLCGIARPESFRQTLISLGALPLDLMATGDHRDFPPRLVKAAVKRAQSQKIPLVITEKDVMRRNTRQLVDNINKIENCEVLVLGVELEITPEDAFRKKLDQVIQKANGGSDPGRVDN